MNIKDNDMKYRATLPENYTILSTSTTNLSANAKVIELAAIKVNNKEMIDYFHSFVSVKNKKSLEKDYYHDYSYEFLAKYPTLDELLPHLLNFIGSDVIAGWYIAFDITKIVNQCPFRYEKYRFYDIGDEYYELLREDINVFNLEFVYNYNFGTPKYYDYKSAMDQCYALYEMSIHHVYWNTHT